ncbi:MAG: hypothetical protein ACRDIB_05925, partial [Ardenticatenaceae bacterium]
VIIGHLALLEKPGVGLRATPPCLPVMPAGGCATLHPRLPSARSSGANGQRPYPIVTKGNVSQPRLLPPSDDPAELARQATRLARHNPSQAYTLLGEAAQLWTRQGEFRQAALLLHRRAALSLTSHRSPVPDLAMAARLLEALPEERSLVLLDLAQALALEGDARRAILTLRESERLARGLGHFELLAAARHALGKLTAAQGDYASARTFLRGAGQAMIYDVESELLATLRDLGNLPHNLQAEQKRAQRQQAVEEELAALKQDLGLP